MEKDRKPFNPTKVELTTNNSKCMYQIWVNLGVPPGDASNEARRLREETIEHPHRRVVVERQTALVETLGINSSQPNPPLSQEQTIFKKT